MSQIEMMRQIAKPLYAFVYKYFEQISPDDLVNLRYDFVLSPLEVYELIVQVNQLLPELFKSTSIEADVMDVWAHKELLLQCLVVMTNLAMTAEPLEQKGRLLEAVQLRDQLIDEFTQKAVEDPDVLHAIANGTIEEEIEKRRQSKDLYNFKPLFEQYPSYVINPHGIEFKEIPDTF